MSSKPSKSSSIKTLSLICPTIGRSSLVTTIESVIYQMQEGDEFIVVGDGPQPTAREIAEKYPQVTYLETPEKVGDFGCTPCDFAIERAKGDVVFFIGDDDTCAKGAFDIIREKVTEKPDQPHLFAMIHKGRYLAGSLDCCAVSGQQIVVPRDMSKMPKMADCPEKSIAVSDWVFIDRVNRRWGYQTVAHDSVIAFLVEQNFGKVF